MADAVTQARDLLRGRLAELQAEVKQVERALQSLNGQRRGRARGTRTRRRSRVGRGERQQQFLAAVKENPSMPTRQLAEKIGISPNRAYGLARQLRPQKMIRRQGKGFKVA